MLTTSFLLDRGFAFSQEKGNDRLLTENLSSRVAAALMQRIENTHGVTFEPLAETADDEPIGNNTLQDQHSRCSLDSPLESSHKGISLEQDSILVKSNTS